MSQRYLHNYRLQPQGLEYVHPGESIQEALNRSQMVVLTQGSHSAADGLTMFAGQWLTGLGPTTELSLGARITGANSGVLSDMAIRAPYGINTEAVKCTNVDRFLVRDVVIDGHVSDQVYGPADNGQMGIHFAPGCRDVQVVRCHVKNFGKDCIYSSGSQDVLVRDCRLQNFSRGGVVSVDVVNLTVSDCTFEDGYDLPTVIGNHGVWLEPDNASAVFTNVSIRGCTFRNLNRGILFYNTQSVANSIIEQGNTFDTCRFGGILFYVADAPRSSQSFFQSCGLAAGDPFGLDDVTAALSVFNSPGATIADHDFRGCGGDLASLMFGPNCRAVSARRCHFSGDAKRSVYAYYVFGAKTRRTFADNVSVDAAGGGAYPAIEVAGSASHVVDTDLIFGNTADIDTYSAGLRTTYTDGGRCSPNYVLGTTGAGHTVTDSAPGLAYVTDLAYTATANDALILSNPTSNSARTVTLPAAFFVGQSITVKDAKGDAGTRNIVVSPASGTIDGGDSDTISDNWGSTTYVRGQTQWHVMSRSP